MGVPSFYRWLVRKYPNIVSKAREPTESEPEIEEEEEENMCSFDNLYLDMNGIIHPCFHPQDEDDQEPPTTFNEVFENIFEYIDWLLKIVRPKKLLFLAIDGVAPRAKMNQQRSRRFRTAKDAEIADSEEETIRKQFEREGRNVLPKQESEVSDSNVITPGTEFMYKLSKALQVYICSRLNTEHGWNIKVILSDANSPGEGEHKIMKFIRLQRNLPGYDPNTRHCLYGLDADLIMLALATHEIYFSILREEVLTVQNNLSCIQVFLTSFPKETTMGLVTSVERADKLQSTSMSRKAYKKPYQFLNIWTLREYLEFDLRISEPPFQIDFERIIDDFIFICFFTGNDFLPHMPSLEIREGAIDLLMAVYRDEFKSRGGYLVDTQKLEDNKVVYVEFKKVEKFILSVGAYEEKIFKKRMLLRQLMVKRLLREMANNADDLEIEQDDSIIQVAPIGDLHLNNGGNYCGESNLKALTSKTNLTSFGMSNNLDDVLKNTTELNKKLKDVMREKSDIFKQGGLERDTIKFGMPGWKERYYKEKFGAESPREIESTRKDIVQKYVEGLLWVLQYYFFGVKSWTWFYPYHYAPFASDLKELGKVSISFDMGTPFKPFDQLMGVLPSRSVCALPKAYWCLITSEQSNLKDYYPTDFDVDIEGKRFLWQGILKLPFIDERLLLSETKKLEKELEEDEIKRNSESKEKLYVVESDDFGSQLASVYNKSSSLKPEANVRHPIDCCASGGINGFISPCMETPKKDTFICVIYEHPDSHPHIPRLHEGVTVPEKTITEDDLMSEPLWHEYDGHRPPYRLHTQDRYKKAPSNPIHPKEIRKGAGSGFSAGRGRGKGNTETFDSKKYECSSGWGPNNVESASCSSSVQMGRGRGHVNMSGNRRTESYKQVQSPSSVEQEWRRADFNQGDHHGYREPPRNLSSDSYRKHAPNFGSSASSPGRGRGWGRGEFSNTSRNQSSGSYRPMRPSNVWENASSLAGQGWTRPELNHGPRHEYREPPRHLTSTPCFPVRPLNVRDSTSSSVGRGWAGSEFHQPGPGRAEFSNTSTSYRPMRTPNVWQNASGHYIPVHTPMNPNAGPYIPMHRPNIGENVGRGRARARADFHQGRGHGYREPPRDPNQGRGSPTNSPSWRHDSSSYNRGR